MSSCPGSNSDFFELCDLAFDGLAIWASQPWRVIYANPEFGQITGSTFGKPVEEALKDCLSPSAKAALFELLEDLCRNDAARSNVSMNLDRDGDRAPLEVKLCRLPGGEPPRIGMIVRVARERDATGSVTADRRDPLTELPDREFLMQRLAVLLWGDRVADRHFAVLFLDLDNFKQVNDEFGHLLGDRVLREAARRIADCVREGDHVVRFGGDEFVVLVEGVAGAEDVEPVISRIETALAQPIALPDSEVTLTLSIGMALASDQYGSPDELLAAADQAMYATKRHV